MLCAILCGGQSSRMGTDKGLLQLNNNNWAQIATDKMTILQIPVVLSVNSSQYDEYASVFNDVQLIKDNTTLQLHGPLCGVLSVHEQNTTEDLFALACDMPLMESFILKKLYDQYKTTPGYQAYLFTNDGEPEPLCAIYTSEGLSMIMQIHQKGKLVRHSMKFMLEFLHCFFIPVPDEQKKCFSNFNAHAALNGL
jgi:molybdopterin-guanine dinucleotide biosynthesis protein A